MLCGNAQASTAIRSHGKVDETCTSTHNNNGIGYTRKKSPHNSWWNSQSSSSRFSSPSYKTESRGHISDGGKNNTYMGRGKI